MASTETKHKVCMLGAYAVGKTSITSRFLHGAFPAKYQTTVGVRIGRKEVRVDAHDLSMLVWDINGEDEFLRVRPTQISGASGCLFVIDGTRRDTLDTVLSLRERVHEYAATAVKLFLLNKGDLRSSAAWEISEEEVQDAVGQHESVIVTSAKADVGVEEAFLDLARRIRNAACQASPARS